MAESSRPTPSHVEREHTSHSQFNIFALRHARPTADYAHLCFDGVMEATRTAQHYVDNLLDRNGRTVNVFPFSSPTERSDETLRVFINIVRDNIQAGILHNVVVHDPAPVDVLDTTKLVRPFIKPGMTPEEAVEIWLQATDGATYKKVVERFMRFGQMGLRRMDPDANMDNDIVASTHSPTVAALDRYFFPEEKIPPRFASLFQLSFQSKHILAVSDNGKRATVALR